MAEILKHVGQVKNTGKRCAVVFNQIPSKETHALIVDTEALPDRIHDPLMNIIRSNEAQQSNNLGEVLNRRLMPDTNASILNELHAGGWMRAEAVTNVQLVPRPNSVILLADMLKALGKLTESQANSIPTPSVTAEATARERGIFADNFRSDNAEANTKIAEGLLAQAQLLDDDANDLRERAYKLAPTLRPTLNVSFKSTPAQVTEEVKANEPEKTTTPRKNSRRKSTSA